MGTSTGDNAQRSGQPPPMEYIYEGDSDWDDYSPVTTCTAESVGSRQRLEDESKSTASASLLVKGDSDATTNSAVSNWLVAAFVFVLAVGVFANTANHGFTFDDQAAVVNNDDLRPTSPVTELFKHDFWGTPIASERSHKSYRPFSTLTFRWTYYYFELDARWYHRGNILLHGIASVMVLLLGRALFVDKRKASIAAVAFAVHPLHCDNVASIVGRADILAAIFYCAGIMAFVNSVGRLSDIPPYNTRSRPFYFALAIVYGFASLLFKEPAFICLPLYGVYELLGLATHLSRTSKSPRSLVDHIRALLSMPAFGRFVVRQITNFVCFCVILAGRFHIARSATQQTIEIFNAISACPDWFTRVLSIPYFHALHYGKLAWPQVLACDYSRDSIPLPDTIFCTQVLYTVAVYAAVFVVMPLGIWSSGDPALGFSWAMMILPFIPCSNLLFWNGYEIAERIMYIPSIGYCYLLAAALVYAWDSAGGATLQAPTAPKAEEPPTQTLKCTSKSFSSAGAGGGEGRGSGVRRVAAAGAIGALMCAYTARTWDRNYDWENESTLWASTAEALPNNARALFNLANELTKSPRVEDKVRALQYYDKACGIAGDNMFYYNYGAALLALDRFNEAERAFFIALEKQLIGFDGRPHGREKTYRGLAALYTKAGEFARAREYFIKEYEAKYDYLLLGDKFVSEHPSHSMLHAITVRGLRTGGLRVPRWDADTIMSIADETKEAHEGHRLMRTGNTLKAVDWYQKELQKYPGHPQLLYELAMCYYSLRHYPECSYVSHAALLHEKSMNEELATMLTLCLRDSGRTDEARQIMSLIETMREVAKNLKELDLLEAAYREELAAQQQAQAQAQARG